MGATESRTSATLIWDVHMGNSEAWNEFVVRYRPFIVGWCRRFGAQSAESEDVAQIVLVKLLDKMRTFAYDPSKGFRSWLRTVTRHAWLDYVDERQRGRQCTVRTDFWDSVDHDVAGRSLEETVEQAWQRELAEQAMAKAKTEVHDRTWRAFELMALEGRKSPEVARVLAMTPGAVLMARHRVTKRIREILCKLEATITELPHQSSNAQEPCRPTERP